MGYAYAVIVLAVVSFFVWVILRVADSAREKKAAEDMRAAIKRRRKGDAVMAEPVADEDGWLASARRRLARKLQDDADD